MFEPTTKSALEYATENKLEEWVHIFLCGEGDNKGFSDGLKLAKRHYAEPKVINFDLFIRCCGPEPNMKWQVDKSGFTQRVNNIADRYKTGAWDMPPLIVNDSDGVLELNDGNHRYEALKTLGINEYWVIIWKTV